MAEEYFHQDYPKMMYNPNGQVSVVQDAEEEKALGSGWHASPSEYGVETCPAAPPGQPAGYRLEGFASPSPASAARPSSAAAPSGTPESSASEETSSRRSRY